MDGLDESPNAEQRQKTIAYIEALTRQYPNCRFAITTRPRAGVQIEGFTLARIEPLDDQARKKFLGDWARLLLPGQPTKADKLQSDILAIFQHQPQIGAMAQNALMLTALAALYWNNKKLPEQRAELYDSVLTWLANARPRTRLNARDCLDHLGTLAFAMQTQPGGRVESLDKAKAAAALHQHLPNAQHFLDQEEIDSGILISDGPNVRFWHLTFQEFLCAHHLHNDRDPAEELLKDNRLYHPEWREVVRLYAGLPSKRRLQAFLGQILERDSAADLETRAHCAALLSAIETDLAPSDFKIHDPRWPQLLRSLDDLWSDATLRLDITVRAAAGEAATRWAAAQPQPAHPALLLPRDPEYWVTIPAGNYLLGAQKAKKNDPNYDAEAQSDEPIHPFKTGPYQMARHPVTVFEYDLFLKATGAEEPGNWTRQLRHPARPVVEVDFLQATAYAQWLAHSLPGVGLPTEDQWEAAARGLEARIYAWGNDWPEGSDHANVEGQVGAPTPVGLFPAGSTPLLGLADMAGNVWEWTSSKYSKEKKLERRVLRGGSWDLDSHYARSACRVHDNPNVRFNSLGFRLTRT